MLYKYIGSKHQTFIRKNHLHNADDGNIYFNYKINYMDMIDYKIAIYKKLDIKFELFYYGIL